MDWRYFTFNEDFIENCNEERDEGYFLEVDVQYFEKFHKIRNDLRFLPDRMNIEKVRKLVATLHGKTEDVVYIRNFEQVHRVIEFNQNAWLKPYININTDLRKKAKIVLKKICLHWWIMQFFEKLEKVRKHGDIKLVTTEKRRNYLLSEPNNHIARFFTEHLLAIEKKWRYLWINLSI